MNVLRATVVCCVAIALAPSAAATPIASSSSETVASFDPATGQFPESLAIDKRGNVYVSFPFRGEIWRLAPDGSRSLFATLAPAGSLCCYTLDNLSVAGLAVDAPGNVYAAVLQSNPAVHGVWRIDHDGTKARLPGSQAILMPNGLAFGNQGEIYVSDSILGAVWLIPRGSTARLWAQDDLLEGLGIFGLGFPIGANGIAYRQGSVYVANTERGNLVRIPVESDGSAGAAEPLVETPALIGADGIALDVHGDIYVGIDLANVILRFGPDGSGPALIAGPANGLNFPAAVAFGTGMGDRTSLFVANYAISQYVGGPVGEPGVLKLDVGVPGMPAP